MMDAGSERHISSVSVSGTSQLKSMTTAKSEKSWLRGEITDHCKEERQKLASISVSVRIRKARFKLRQGKQMVETRGKLTDANDDKAARRLSTEIMDLAIGGMRTQNGQTSTGCDLSIHHRMAWSGRGLNDHPVPHALPPCPITICPCK